MQVTYFERILEWGNFAIKTKIEEFRIRYYAQIKFD